MVSNVASKCERVGLPLDKCWIESRHKSGSYRGARGVEHLPNRQQWGVGSWMLAPGKYLKKIPIVSTISSQFDEGFQQCCG